MLTMAGGHLALHVDFNRDSRRHLDRAVSALYYAPVSWEDAWGGELELWDAKRTRCEVSIAPRRDRLVVMAFGEEHWHGHPAPLRCPDGVGRAVVAAYFYRARSGERDDDAAHARAGERRLLPANSIEHRLQARAFAGSSDRIQATRPRRCERKSAWPSWFCAAGPWRWQLCRIARRRSTSTRGTESFSLTTMPVIRCRAWLVMTRVLRKFSEKPSSLAIAASRATTVGAARRARDRRRARGHPRIACRWHRACGRARQRGRQDDTQRGWRARRRSGHLAAGAGYAAGRDSIWIGRRGTGEHVGGRPVRAQGSQREGDLFWIARGSKDPDDARREHRREERLEIDAEDDVVADVWLRGRDDRAAAAKSVGCVVRWNVIEDSFEETALHGAQPPLRRLDEPVSARRLGDPGVVIVVRARIGGRAGDAAAIGEHQQRVDVEADPGRQLTGRGQWWHVPGRLGHLGRWRRVMAYGEAVAERNAKRVVREDPSCELARC